MSDKKLVLLPGGAGYIGSHTAVVLLQAGYEVLVVDNFSNSSEISLQRIENITEKKCPYVRGDIRDRKLLLEIFQQYDIYAVMNFAGLKAVGESCKKPLSYYNCNVFGVINLLEVMQERNVKTFVFSSSATVYGDAPIPYTENTPTGIPISPYGRTKLHIEQILSDLYNSDNAWNIAILRYFNPISAIENGLLGENPQGIPNNLAPYIAKVAAGKLKELAVFGNDYPTVDGTGVRDYIHIMDLAEGHLRALNYLENNHPNFNIWNLGTGSGYSVLEIVRAFEKETGITIPYKITARRPGDLPEFYADPSKAERELNWKAKRDINAMMRDLWNFIKNNPNGYE
ncbi:MAG: UDP-glucose 4-epimerase GalE [Cardiobacteriaceae bacterium]|nr:UDP-glucose 4-epimerase GalE [Cardiobacteriaceae bacterium]